MKNPGIALIGCGRIGFLLESDPLRNKPCTHFGGAVSAGLKITHACDIDPARLNRFAGLAGIRRENTFVSYKRLIADSRPRLVIIGTWTDSHARIGIRAAESGTKIIVCEKPVSSDLRSAQKLLDACAANDTRLIVNHERRYDGRYRAVRKMLDAGTMGEVKTVYGSILTGSYRGASRIEQGGGPLLHDGTHMVDILRFFFGDFLWVQGELSRDGREYGFEDRAMAWIRTKSGIDIILESGGSRNYFVFEIIISGTRGKLVIGNGYQKLYLSGKSRFYTGFRDLVSRPFPRTGKINCFREEYREVKRLLFSDEGPVSSTGMDGYKALETIHGIYLSAHLNKKKIEFPVKPDTIRLKKIFNL